jgi:long-subunit acyl-CoA synthetase (AMP-forming)
VSLVIDAIRRHAATRPDDAAVVDGCETLSYAQLADAVDRLADRLVALAPRMIGLYADNSVGWALTDLAALHAGIPIVPLPLFASHGQIAHVLRETGIDFVVTDRQHEFCEVLPSEAHLTLSPFREGLFGIRMTSHSPCGRMPANTWKITFTSGTTGDPKGVCLSAGTLERTAQALCRASAGTSQDRHLSVLPLATLLENVGGIYAPLLAGAVTHVPSLASVGLSGSSTLDIGRLVTSLHERRATSAILVPGMLAAMVGAAEDGASVPGDLRFLAVGGASVSSSVLEAALALGLPIHEGYGLSECGSVVSVNRPGACRPGSVGRPLPHLRVDIARDGEIVVHGSACLGYLGDDTQSAPGEPVETGDLGYLDDAGYLHVTGRRKNVFITAFGRNIAPEWVERQLIAKRPIGQAAVFGEARPFNAAVIVPQPAATLDAVATAIDEVNRQLPDYARVNAWIVASEPFSAFNGLSTENGRLRRHAILRVYGAKIDALYRNPRVSA